MFNDWRELSGANEETAIEQPEEESSSSSKPGQFTHINTLREGTKLSTSKPYLSHALARTSQVFQVSFNSYCFYSRYLIPSLLSILLDSS